MNCIVFHLNKDIPSDYNLRSIFCFFICSVSNSKCNFSIFMVQMVVLWKRSTSSLPDKGYQRKVFDVWQSLHLIIDNVSKESRQLGKGQGRNISTLLGINEKKRRYGLCKDNKTCWYWWSIQIQTEALQLFYNLMANSNWWYNCIRKLTVT